MFIITLGYIYIIVNNNIILLSSQMWLRWFNIVCSDNKILLGWLNRFGRIVSLRYV